MSKVKIENLARDLATLLGESLMLECQPEESPFPGIEERTRLLAPSLLEKIILEAPAEMLSDFKILNGSAVIDSQGMATVTLPDDFLRLGAIQMNDWQRPVTELTDPLSEKGLRQFSQVKGVKGSPERPVAIRGIKKGAPCLLLFSCSQDASLSSFLYMARPAIGADDTLDIPDSLYYTLLDSLAQKVTPSII